MASEPMAPMGSTEAAPRTGGALVGGVLAAFGASACCAGPLLLVTLGVGGVWAARVRALEPLQPLFVAAAMLAVGWAFHRLYIAPRRCAPRQACAAPAVLRRQRMALWIALAVIVALAGFPWLAPLLY